MFLYMVAELSALRQAVNALTGMNGLPAVIVQCVVTTIYTCTCQNIELQCCGTKYLCHCVLRDAFLC